MRIPFFTDWGGTPHLENLKAADAKYRERIFGWSDGKTFARWSNADRQSALSAPDQWKGSADTAEEYWQYVANWWRSPDAQYLQIDTLQKAKILDSVDSSSNAATGYVQGRDVTEYLPEPENLIPWWVYGIAGLVIWNTIRK
jgi:hypothetical protein